MVSEMYGPSLKIPTTHKAHKDAHICKLLQFTYQQIYEKVNLWQATLINAQKVT